MYIKIITNCFCAEKLEQVEHQKYLGMLIDEFACWKPHVYQLKKKLRCFSYNFYFIKEFLPQDTLEIIYSALVESNIMYGITLYGQASTYLLNELQSIQNVIKRHITAKQQNNDTKRKILNIEQLFKLRTVLNNYKDITGWLRVYNIHNTRAVTDGKFIVAKSNNKYGERRKEVFVRKIFNDIPFVVNEMKSKQYIKNKTTEWLLKEVK